MVTTAQMGHVSCWQTPVTFTTNWELDSLGLGERTIPALLKTLDKTDSRMPQQHDARSSRPPPSSMLLSPSFLG